MGDKASAQSLLIMMEYNQSGSSTRLLNRIQAQLILSSLHVDAL